MAVSTTNASQERSRSLAEATRTPSGTKRWTTVVGICVRVREGSAGDRYDRYPAEAFAESYRALVDRVRGVPFSWPIVDRSFVRGPRALAAIRADVLDPWAPVTTRTRGVLHPDGTVRYALSTPYDGTLTARMVAERGLRTDVTLAMPSGSALKRGLGRATATLCGQRDVRVIVRATAGSGRFTLVVTQP